MTNRRSLRSRRPTLETTLLLVLALAASPAAAQLVPLGPPEQIDPQAILSDCPRVAGRENRTFVVAWGEQALDTATVRARRFDADGPVTDVIVLDGGRLDGRPLGPEVGVADGFASALVLGSGPGGRTAVAWVEQGPSSAGGTLFLRFFDATGALTSEPLAVDQAADHAFDPVALAVDRFGRALVVWTEGADPGAGTARHAVQLWSPEGAESDPFPLGASLPQICASAAAAGRLWAVAWLDQIPDGTGHFGVLIRRFFAP